MKIYRAAQMSSSRQLLYKNFVEAKGNEDNEISQLFDILVSCLNKTRADRWKKQRAKGESPAGGAGHEVMLAKQPDNLPIVGKTPGFMFGIHLLAVRADSEHTAGTGDQFNLSTKFFFQCSLHTGGSGLVVSRSAIFNGDLYRYW